jgi:hypothetical protein
MLSYPGKVWQRLRDRLPCKGFHFDRPIVVIQSDDWGRVGLRDREALEQLRSAGLALGEQPYDFYSLETAEDICALGETLTRHRDSSGRHPCLQMNFILTNLDFAKMSADSFSRMSLLPLADGLPQGWRRPGLFEAYRQGISDGVFRPALHGTTHFCRSSIERHLEGNGERAALLRSLWRAGVPYIHWRMPWIGYEYWDPEKSEDERMLPAETQLALVGQAVGAFAKMFSIVPHSACAPGYRANHDTYRAWAQHGIRVAQNGPGSPMPPHFERCELLHISRTVEFEPATDRKFSVQRCLKASEECFALGLPAIVSVHSINFHSAVEDFRTPTLRALEQFLTALESTHADLLYLHDDDLYELVAKGSYQTADRTMQANVIEKSFTKAGLTRRQTA